MNTTTPRCCPLSVPELGDDLVYFYARWKGQPPAFGGGDREDLVYYLRVEAASPAYRPLYHIDVSTDALEGLEL